MSGTVRALVAASALACACASQGTATVPSTPSSVAAPGTGAGTAFALTTPVANEGGTLPVDYTCDGVRWSPPLSWSDAPAGTREFALLMTTLPGDGTIKWNWVLYGIPAATTSLPANSMGVGIAGVGSDGPAPGYQPPCSQGPGLKLYTFTLYALTASARLSVPANQVTGALLTTAIAPITLGSASITLGYTRSR